MTHDITIEGGTSLRLKTAGKYCDRDIVVTSTGGGGAEIVLQSKSATPTKSVQEITADAGYTALERVTVNAIPDEYIIPAGTKAISQNGTHSVTEYAQVSVNVPIPDGYIQPSGTKEITENGTHDVTEYASVNVNVATSGGGEDLVGATLNGTLTAVDSNVTNVISYACYGITTIQSVNLPNATTIASYAFRGCSGITSFNAPKLTSIGSYGLYGCNKIKELNFQGISSVPSSTFYQCTGLVKVDLGVKCQTLSSNAFAYCSKLDTLILRYPGVVSINSSTFSGANFNGNVYIPAVYVADYEANSGWGSYGGNATFRAIEDYPDITGG